MCERLKEQWLISDKIGAELGSLALLRFFPHELKSKQVLKGKNR
jgi:hypothetical protein